MTASLFQQASEMEWINPLLKFFGAVAGLSVIVIYVGRKAVNALFNARVETHKAEPQRIATEHSIRFQTLHAERAEIMKDCYAKLAALDGALASTLGSFQAAGEAPLAEKVSQVSERYNALLSQQIADLAQEDQDRRRRL
jgi:hypothetical protein